MSIVIEGLELPEDKTVQIIIENKRFGGVYCNTLGEKGLHRLGRVEETVFKLPAEHGRLIDGDALIDELPNNLGIRGLEYLNRQESAIVSWIHAAPTIIPAEVDE